MAYPPQQPFGGGPQPPQPYGQQQPYGAYPVGGPPPGTSSGSNLKWILGIGCLGALILLGCFVGGIIYAVASSFKSSEVYVEAVSRARDDERVQAALGTPIEEGFMPTGSMSTGPSGGRADIAISLSGPEGDGALLVNAEKLAGEWQFRALVLQLDGGKRIDLAAGDDGADADDDEDEDEDDEE